MPDVTLSDGTTLRYACDVSALDAELRERFVALEHDEEAARFVELARAHRHGPLRTRVYAGLRRVLSDYDAYGLLDMYAMHLLSASQLRELLGPRTDAPRTLLDCGAGRGDVTVLTAPLFQRVMVTEASAVMRRRLRRRGYTVLDHALMHGIDLRFDAILWLNVLDRCSHPRTLLATLRDLLKPGGRLVVAVPLPLSPHVQCGGLTADPEETLPEPEPGWERGASSVAKVLRETGLQIERLSRAPYMTCGDAHTPLHVLDDAVFVCTRSA